LKDFELTKPLDSLVGVPSSILSAGEKRDRQEDDDPVSNVKRPKIDRRSSWDE
jgi:hypothetical protein